MKKSILAVLILVGLFLFGCKQTPEHTAKTFDVDNLLKEVTEKVIVPSMKTFSDEAGILFLETTEYAENPTTEKLGLLREQWVKTALAYESTYNFHFGVAKSRFLHQAIYNWPTVPGSIEDFIQNKEVNEETMRTVSPQIKGLSALEYLLFKSDLEQTNDQMVNQPKRRAYLKQSTAFLNTQAKRLYRIWDVDGDNYTTTFLTRKETGINNSFNLLFNGLYNAANTAKVTKIGKPAGLENSPRTSPDKVQAPYSNTSLALTLQSVEVIEDAFFGEGHQNISTYIETIAEDDAVNKLIKAAIDDIKAAIDAIPVPLEQAVDEYPEEVENLHTKITALNIWMAVDARSVLSIIITSTDNDGD